MAVYNNNGNLNNLQRQIQDLQQQYQAVTNPNSIIDQDNLPANSSEIIMDRDENIFYQVSKDANGIPSRRIVRCRFEVEEIQEEEPMVLTRKEFDDFKAEIRQLFASQNQKQVTLSSGVKKE